MRMGNGTKRWIMGEGLVQKAIFPIDLQMRISHVKLIESGIYGTVNSTVIVKVDPASLYGIIKLAKK